MIEVGILGVVCYWLSTDSADLYIEEELTDLRLIGRLTINCSWIAASTQVQSGM